LVEAEICIQPLS